MEMRALLASLGQYRNLLSRGLGTPLLVLASLGMVVLPMPPFLLDILFTFNIALSLVVLLVTIYSRRPLDFAAFPTILLVATLLRLALNVASTRVVLLEGHNGPGAAGHVIEHAARGAVGREQLAAAHAFGQGQRLVVVRGGGCRLAGLCGHGTYLRVRTYKK